MEAIRLTVRSWRRGPGVPGPPPDGQLEQIIEVMRPLELVSFWRSDGALPTRVVSVPGFVAEVLRQRLVVVDSVEPEHRVFFTRKGAPLTTTKHSKSASGRAPGGWDREGHAACFPADGHHGAGPDERSNTVAGLHS
ncbi:hypothetical protein [Prescottella agglutinans]|uniref:hypothetical protein n=1 Tax=Prescottella agglutinans TaxID=1644129 RepID=UPI003D98A594